MNPVDFRSSFAAEIEKFISHKRAVGYKYDTQIRILKGFDSFCADIYPKEHTLSRELLLAWAKRKPGESIGTQRVRVNAIRQLVLFARQLGHDAYLLSPAILAPYQRYTPYIFSNEELAALFDRIDSCPYWPANPLRQREYPLLFRLLYCCGFRVSEVCRMKVLNWHEDRGLLTVHDGKYSRERQVPLAADIALRTQKYCASVHRFSAPETYLFPSHKGPHLSKQAVYNAFRQFLWQAGISHGGKGKGPRVHDLRHTFAVHRLKQCVEKDRDINAFLPILKTYLGHTHIGQTAYYLRLTADVFPSVLSAVESTFPGLIPETGEYYEDN